MSAATVTRIPFLQDIKLNLEWFRENPEAVTEENVTSAFCHVGSHNAPELLLYLHLVGRISTDLLAATIGDAWSSAHYPESLGRQNWFEMFEAAGYTVDGKPAALPAEPLTLYRGAPDKFKRRMSWTAGVETAQKFASGDMPGRTPGKLWTATVEPYRLLAHLNDRQETEYVVNTVGLRITEVKL